MCNVSCIIFGCLNLPKEEIEGKRFIEVGSRDVNGSLRLYVERFNPSEYIGIDIEKGRGVDLIVRAEDMVNKFGRESFDVVIATEVLDHILDWRLAVSNMKHVVKSSSGIILVTVRSRKFPYHPYPEDYWRFEDQDLLTIFSDCYIQVFEKDIYEPGLLMKAYKPEDFRETDLSWLHLYSMKHRKRMQNISILDL